MVREMSGWVCALSGKCLREMYGWESLLGMCSNRLVGEVRIGEVSIEDLSSGKSQTGICSIGEPSAFPKKHI